MAANNSGQEKTEAATPRKRQKAHEEGQVPRSQELTGAIVLLAGASGIALTAGSDMGAEMIRLLNAATGWLTSESLNIGAASEMLRLVTMKGLAAVLPFMLSLFTLVLFVNLVQARGVLSLHPIKPKWSHLNPLKGLAKIFSKQAVFNLLKSVLKIGFLVAVTYLACAAVWDIIISLNGFDSVVILGEIKSIIIRLTAFTGLAYLIVAAMDYAFQVFQHEKNLRMTKEEVMREHKETEGDPLIKGRMRALARQLIRKQMLAAVPDADVVITNPTHIAVALKYDINEYMAPVVVAMGERKLAEKIKAIAYKHDVPLVENRPLAHALLATSEIGKPISPTLYVAVAEVLAFVYRQKQKRSGTGRLTSEVA